MIVLITSDRGLAGAFNSNIIRVAQRFAHRIGKPVRYVSVGKKGRDSLIRSGAHVVAEFSTFGSDPTLVTNMGRAYLKGLTDGGVIGCLKHFPGLGSANLDPHLALPTMNRSLATLHAVDLVPYRTMINEGIVPMVMVTHILNPQLDPNLPTSLSANVVTGLLRKQLNFQGVIISDTLWMGGISNTYSLAQAAVLAVKAGEDLLLGPRGLADTQHMIYGLQQAVMSGQITQTQIDASVTRIPTMKLHYNVLPHAKALQMARNAINVGIGAALPKSGITGVVMVNNDEDVKRD